MDRADTPRRDRVDEGGVPDAPEPAQAGRDSGETELRTFLIADIRGYTKYTRERGDAAAADLASRFAQIVREVIAARGGFLLELRGDEALVVFVSARQALRAAIELQERFEDAGLARGVGIGLDAGEAVPVEGGYRGGALNLAARLCAQAGPGQVLASEAVIHLAARVEGLAYVEPRSFRLKGLADPVRAVTVVPEQRAPRGLQRRLRRARRLLSLDRRSGIAAAVAIAAVAAAGVGAWIATDGFGSTDGGGSGQEGGTLVGIAVDALPTLAVVDSADGELVGTARVPNPVDVYFIDGSFWAFGLDPKALYRVDPATREVVQTVTIPLAKEGWWTLDDDIVWFTDHGAPGRVIGIDVNTGVVVRDFDVRLDSEDLAIADGVAVGAGSLWVSRLDTEEIIRLDPVSGEVQARIEGFSADILAFGEGAIWGTGFGEIARIDPATNRLSFEPRELARDHFLPYIAFGGGHAWTADEEQGIVWKVDRSGSVVGTYQTGAGARALSFADGVMWVGNLDAGTVSAIDVVTGEVTTHELGHSIAALAAADGGQLAVAVWPGVADHLATLDGELLRIAMASDPFYALTPDPPVALSFELRHAEHATCASLLNYPDEPAPEGWELQPEVADEMPELSEDETTYTFQIGDGFAFSPPSNEPVTAETFRYSIQRALSPDMGQFSRGIGLLGDIVGAQAFHAGETDAIEGLSAEGNTLTIRLEAPAPDFPARLTLPYFCPVPIGTPVALDGLDPRPPLPSAGPYYLAQHEGGELAVLSKNPNYSGPRPRNFDHIVIRMGLDAGEAVRLVQSGEMHAAITSPFRSLLSPAGDLAREWGPGSEAAANGDQRWFGGPRFGSAFVALNPESELFADVAVRRAVSLAIDRAGLAATGDEAPFVGLLPPSVPGSLPIDTPVPEPDVEAALELMAGRTGSAVIVAPTQCLDCVDFANTLAGNFAAIGIELEVREVEGDPFEEMTAPDSDVDVMNGFLDVDYPDPASLLGSIRQVPWLPESVLAELDRVEGLSGEERIEAAAELAGRLSDEEHLAIPAAYPVYPMFIGENVGCAFVQPAVGAVDLVSLCLE